MSETSRDKDRISVFLVDDHEIFRRGIRALLDSEGDIDVVGEAETAAAALARMPALRPDVALLDVRLPDGDGISVCREISSALPGTACLMLTAYGDDQALLGAIMAGAHGYVSKQTCGTDLVSALRTVASGQSILDPQASGQVMARLRQRVISVDPVAALSEQEKRVLDLIGEGLSNRQIAERMFLAEKTVKNYVSSLLTKLGMQRRTQAAAFAVRHADDLGELSSELPGRAIRPRPWGGGRPADPADRGDGRRGLAPLGVGRHVDHLITRRAARELGSPVVYYSDFPYSQAAAPEPGFIRDAGLVPHSWLCGRAENASRIAGYRTQFAGLFRDGTVPARPEIYWLAASDSTIVT